MLIEHSNISVYLLQPNNLFKFILIIQTIKAWHGKNAFWFKHTAGYTLYVFIVRKKVGKSHPPTERKMKNNF